MKRQQLGRENTRNISRFLLFKSCCNWWQVHFYPHPAFPRLLGIYGIYGFYVPADRMWRLIDQNRASLICCSPENSYWLNKANIKVVHWPWFCFLALNATTKLFFQLPCNIQQYKVQMWVGNVYYGWKYTLGRCCWIVQSLLWTTCIFARSFLWTLELWQEQVEKGDLTSKLLGILSGMLFWARDYGTAGWWGHSLGTSRERSIGEKQKDTGSCLCPREPQLDRVSVTTAVMLCLTMQHKMLASNEEFSTFHFTQVWNHAAGDNTKWPLYASPVQEMGKG